ncbi:MAG: hypothetical protein ACXIU7_08280 [Roseinatronobacter sp.]
MVAYGEILGRDAGQSPIPPARLIVPMLNRSSPRIAALRRRGGVREGKDQPRPATRRRDRAARCGRGHHTV